MAFFLLLGEVVRSYIHPNTCLIIHFCQAYSHIEFTLYELKCTIHAILQHMGFYHTTENPCVMMRAKNKTKSCECIIIHQDELYIASSTIQDILHIVKEKYNIKINSNVYQGSNFPYDPGGTMIC